MSANLVLRGSELIWYIRFVQLICTGFVLVVVALSASEWTAAECSIPPTLSVNIVAASLTAPILVYLLTATGPFRVSLLPWSQYFQLGLDATLFLAWLIATPASEYTCAAACKSCDIPNPRVKEPYSFYLWVGRLTCTCQLRKVKGLRTLKHVARKVLRQARHRPGKRFASTKVVTNVMRIAQRRHFDMALIFLFTVSTLLTALSVYRHYRLVSRLGQGSPHATFLPKEYQDPEALEKRCDEKQPCPSKESPGPSTPLSVTRTLSNLSDMLRGRDSAPHSP